MTVTLPLILVVDDNPWFREFLEDLLSSEGYRFMAGEPGESLSSASTEPPALAVLDAVMPGMDGPSLCRQLREVDATRDTPVLFLTGLPEQALVTQLIDCDGWSYLSIPCTPEELLDAVQQQVTRPGVSS